VSERPAYLEAADGHSAWVNSRALAAAGITKATPDPPGGRIERDPRTGEPSGTLRENALDLVSRLLPEYTVADKEAGILRMLPVANRLGITALYEARSDSSELAAYLELDHRGQLTARVLAAMYLDPVKEESQIERLNGWRERFRSPHLRANAVKLYADGVIEARTAALLQPYVGRPGDRGSSDFEPEALDRLVTALDRAGFQVHVHAIGDRAVRMALDGFAAARSANGSRDSRHMMAHLQLIDPLDVPRFRELGVIADIQGLWAYPDDYITELTVPKLGAARSRRIYPNGSLARSGAVLVGGSDWSVSSLNPLDAIQVAMTRRDLDSGPGAAWLPDQTVDLATMLAAYTIEGAYAAFEEEISGSVEVGKAADLIVLDRNLFTVPVTEIHWAKVLLTLLEGREVFRDSVALTAVNR
ncbi:MAG: amidohydrolase, partial [Gemmatimonadales bacterium]